MNHKYSPKHFFYINYDHIPSFLFFPKYFHQLEFYEYNIINIPNSYLSDENINSNLGIDNIDILLEGNVN